MALRDIFAKKELLDKFRMKLLLSLLTCLLNPS